MQRRRDAVRWLVKSGGGYLLGIAGLALWIDGLGVAAEWAALLNWAIISVLSYLLVNWWVFGDSDSPTGLGHVRRYASMQSVMVVSKGINYLIYLGLLAVTHYAVAWTVGAVATLAISFFGNRLLWRRTAFGDSAKN